MALSLCLASCGGGTSSAESGGSGENNQQTPPSFDYSVLMMGNSHTSVANLPLHLTQLLRAGLPGMTVTVAVAPDWMFLDEHLSNPRTLGLLNGRSWRAVVLQAQKYSSSGQFSYSTQEAQQLGEDRAQPKCAARVVSRMASPGHRRNRADLRPAYEHRPRQSLPA